MEFKSLLTKLRASAGVDKTELANRIGVHPTYIMALENGTAKKPATLDRCRQIGEALHLSPAETQQLIDAAMKERLTPEITDWLEARSLPFYKVPVFSLSQIDQIDFSKPLPPQIATTAPDDYVWADEKGESMIAIVYTTAMGGGFSKGDRLLVDLAAKPTKGSFVLVKDQSSYKIIQYEPAKSRDVIVIGKIAGRYSKF